MNTNPPPLERGRTYHIYNRGVNREPIFHSRDNYRYFLDLYIKHVGALVDTYAYCLLGNHFHFLVRVKTIEELASPDLTGFRNLSGLHHPHDKPPSQHFSNFFNAYARAFNRRYDRTGALFQRPFGRIPVTTDEYFAYLVVYIHQNPQKHGLVDHYRDWPWSSYDALAGDKPTRLNRTAVLDYLGGRAGYEFIHRQDLTTREDASGL
jgi:putative transposase